MTEAHAEFMGDDLGEGGLAEAGRAEDEQMIEGLAAPPGRLDGDGELLSDRLLPEVFAEAARPQTRLDASLLRIRTG